MKIFSKKKPKSETISSPPSTHSKTISITPHWAPSAQKNSFKTSKKQWLKNFHGWKKMPGQQKRINLRLTIETSKKFTIPSSIDPKSITIDKKFIIKPLKFSPLSIKKQQNSTNHNLGFKKKQKLI